LVSLLLRRLILFICGSAMLHRGDFRPWSKAELRTMKEAGDKEAKKLEHDTQAQLPFTQEAKV
jgi:hypothetical protein